MWKKVREKKFSHRKIEKLRKKEEDVGERKGQEDEKERKRENYFGKED
jgi:hypothetical protein